MCVCRSCGEAGTQTSELLSYDAAVQTTEKASVAVSECSASCMGGVA